MTHPLSSEEISNAFRDKKKNTQKGFAGVFLQDELNDMSPETGKIYVINFLRSSDPDKEIGHWVLISNLRDQSILYIDPFGQDPPERILAFMKRARKRNGQKKECIFSITDIQNITSELCGYYVIIIGKLLLRHKSLVNIMENFELINTKVNDYMVKNLVRQQHFKTIK